MDARVLSKQYFGFVQIDTQSDITESFFVSHYNLCLSLFGLFPFLYLL